MFIFIFNNLTFKIKIISNGDQNRLKYLFKNSLISFIASSHQIIEDSMEGFTSPYIGKWRIRRRQFNLGFLF